MSDAKPILSPAQVELCAKEMGWAVRPGRAGESSEIRDWTSGGSPWKPIYDETDPRFLFPLESLLMEWFEFAKGSTSLPESFWYRRRYPREPVKFFDSHADAVLQAALVKICWERNE